MEAHFYYNMFPGPSFGIKGPDASPAQLFWCFHFIATGLHGLHMIVGVVLVAWIARGARRGLYSPAYHTPVEKPRWAWPWSFVDTIWLLLFPMIYLAGGLGRRFPCRPSCSSGWFCSAVSDLSSRSAALTHC